MTARDLTIIRALMRIDPAKARESVLTELESEECNLAKVAAKFEVSVRSVYRWIDDLGLWVDIDRLCERKGWHREPGPPRRSSR